MAGERADEARFVEMYERHFPSIHSFCARRTSHERVDDAVAETFLVAWRRIVDVPDGREALLWLYGVARRVVGHQWRGSSRRGRMIERLGAAPADSAPGPEHHAVVDDECRTVMEAIDRLRPEESELLLLVAWEGLTPDDLAAVLGVTPNTASQRLSRARKRLVREYDRLESDPDRSPAAPEGGVR